LDDRVRERVVLVAGDHVRGVAHTGGPRPRDLGGEGLDALLGPDAARDTPPLRSPRTSNVGTRMLASAASNRFWKSSRGTSVRPREMNCGSQCQYQRPSGFCRSTFMSP